MKILIVRLSSFGDILQAQACLSSLYAHSPEATIDWLVRLDFVNLLKTQPLRRVIPLHREQGFLGLLKIIWQLSAEGYTHLYDAHNNVRSFWVRLLLPLLSLVRRGIYTKTLVRSKNRFRRFLFFKMGLPTFKMPFRGSQSFLDPLAAWGVSPVFLQQSHWQTTATASQNLPASYIALAPSAAWETKRWPASHWQKLISLLPEFSFVILGGPRDHFCQEIANIDTKRVLNLAGRLSLEESCAVIAGAILTVSGDTGLLHAADQMRKSNIGLIGPTAFGYTSQDTSVILETHLPCKPCSKDGRNRCTNSVFQKCMIDISPLSVATTARQILGHS